MAKKKRTPAPTSVATEKKKKAAAKKAAASKKTTKKAAPKKKAATKKTPSKKPPVPEPILVEAYVAWGKIKGPNPPASDKIHGDSKLAAEFRATLPAKYHDVDPASIGGQLESLRKAAKLPKISGRKGPSAGHAIRKLFTQEAADLILAARGLAKQAGHGKADIRHLIVALGGHAVAEISRALGEDINLTELFNDDRSTTGKSGTSTGKSGRKRKTKSS